MRAYKANMIPGGVTPTINVSQYDNDYAVTVTLIEGAEIYTPPAGATIRVEGTKPDGHGFEYPCTYQGNVVTMPIYTQMTVVSGRFPIELVVYQSGLRVGSCNIIFAVEKAPLGEDTDISETVIPDIIAGAQAQADAAAASAATASSAETNAVSARDAAIEAAQAAGESVSDLKSAFIYSKVNPYSLTTESPGYFTTSGSISAQSSTNLEVYSDFIPLPSGVEGFTFKWWLLTANGGSAWIRAIFYDASKVMLDNASGSIVMVGEDGDYTLYRRTFILPTGTAFVRISYRTFGNHKAQIVYGEDSNYGLSATDIDTNLSRAATPSYAFDHIGIRGIAHRGFCHDGAPENTIPAFRAAVANGFDFIEADLRFTSDGVPVLLHDASINRTARNADGTEISTTINIANITYAQALTYDFGIWAGSEYVGTKIPTLYEFLYFCRDTGSYPYVDCALTSSAMANLIIVAQKIVDMGMQDRVTFISSNELVLQAYLSVCPKFRVGILLNSDLDSARQKVVKFLMSAFNRVFINCKVDKYTTYHASIDAFCEEQGIELELWTIDSPEIINSLPSIVRGVTSNTYNFKVVKRQIAMGTNN